MSSGTSRALAVAPGGRLHGWTMWTGADIDIVECTLRAGEGVVLSEDEGGLMMLRLIDCRLDDVVRVGAWRTFASFVVAQTCDRGDQRIASWDALMWTSVLA
jgi:hypothetical protein